MALKMKRKRSKMMIVLLFPVFVCVFVFGWVMYWVGASKPVKTKPVEEFKFTVLEAPTIER
jgi:hypothetical protein